MIGLRRCALMCVSLCAMMFWPASTGAASSALMTVRIHVSGDMHLDRLYQYPAVLHDTGCTLIRQYAPPDKPHAYSYTLTINKAPATVAFSNLTQTYTTTLESACARDGSPSRNWPMTPPRWSSVRAWAP